ncbi:MAG TPA: hypothetical protein PLY70_19735, partial [Saprospiraceae bacterium]|nr:hypothetical protein [Saprospiraceae bacterium]
KDIVMPTPDAASMGKFTDIPVDYSTGVANISVPIHGISYGPLSASVNMNYHSGGVKLGEPATWVGLNWSLNAGGMISRTVQGLPDDGSSGYASQSTLPTTLNSCETGTWDYSYSDAVAAMTAGTLDLQPDIFNLSYPGGSAKFYITHDKKIVKINRENDDSIRFILDPNYLLGGFEVMSGDGTKYFFGKENASSDFNVEFTVSGSNPAYISTWYLSKISTPDGKYVIKYKYESENYTSISKQTRKFTQNNSNPGGGENNVANRDSASLPGYNVMTIQGKRLHSISSLQDSIVFHANTTRLDISGTKRLDSISCFSIINKSNFCKRFVFIYDYFEDPSASSFAYSKRLQLKQIQEKSCDQSINKPPYIFEYEGLLNPNGKIFLPHRLSQQIDHWGFYNGKSTNDGLEVNIPNTTVYGSFNGQAFTYGSANRNVDTSFVRRGTIKKITYPTGGNTEFQYESNVISDYTFISSTNVISNLATCTSPNATCCGTKEVTSSTVNLNATQLQYLKFTLNGYKPSECTSSSGTYNVHLRVFSGANQIGLITINFAQSGSLVNMPINTLATLQPNTNYTFKVTSYDCRGELNLFYENYAYIPISGPGIRVKQMTFNEGASLSASKSTTFDYMNSGNMTTKKPKYANVT